jgi:hypothetical protein
LPTTDGFGKMEARPALDALMDRVETIELQPGADAKMWTRSAVSRDPKNLSVRFAVAD